MINWKLVTNFNYKWIKKKFSPIFEDLDEIVDHYPFLTFKLKDHNWKIKKYLVHNDRIKLIPWGDRRLKAWYKNSSSLELGQTEGGNNFINEHSLSDY